MKSVLMSMCIVVCGAGFAYAVDEVDETPPIEPTVDASSGGGSDSAPALVFLAIIGVVIASGGGFYTTRDANSEMMIGVGDVEDDAGF